MSAQQLLWLQLFFTYTHIRICIRTYVYYSRARPKQLSVSAQTDHLSSKPNSQPPTHSHELVHLTKQHHCTNSDKSVCMYVIPPAGRKPSTPPAPVLAADAVLQSREIFIGRQWSRICHQSVYNVYVCRFAHFFSLLACFGCATSTFPVSLSAFWCFLFNFLSIWRRFPVAVVLSSVECCCCYCFLAVNSGFRRLIISFCQFTSVFFFSFLLLAFPARQTVAQLKKECLRFPAD